MLKGVEDVALWSLQVFLLCHMQKLLPQNGNDDKFFTFLGLGRSC
jgi:hypothetical protein